MPKTQLDWTGLAYPFRIENGGAAKSRSVVKPKNGTSPHLSESIRQICTTMVSERLVNQELGLKIRPYQFATFSAEFDAYITYAVREAIEKFDTRIKVVDVVVDRDKYEGRVALQIQWKLREEILGSVNQEGYRTEILFGEGGVAE